MAKTFQIHLRIEAEMIETLKKQANDLKISVAELCRQKLGVFSQLTKIELMLENIEKKLNTKLNLNRR